MLDRAVVPVQQQAGARLFEHTDRTSHIGRGLRSRRRRSLHHLQSLSLQFLDQMVRSLQSEACW